MCICNFQGIVASASMYTKRIVAGGLPCVAALNVLAFGSDKVARNEMHQSNGVEWAYPSPYDPVPPDRFINVSHLTKQVAVWDLKGLMNVWENSSGEESWPWVWCWHNPVGPHHVFIQVSKDTLHQTSRICRESERNNLTVVVRSMNDLKSFDLTPEMLYKNRCAIIEGVSMQQIDTENKIMMLNDERIIAYDHAYFS